MKAKRMPDRFCGWCKRVIPGRRKGQWRSAWIKDAIAAHRPTCTYRRNLERAGARGYLSRGLFVLDMERRER